MTERIPAFFLRGDPLFLERLVARFPSVDPQVVGEMIEMIAVRDGIVRPEAVVEEGRPENSPLHGLFEWDDKVAADLWRAAQAELVVASLFKSGR